MLLISDWLAAWRRRRPGGGGGLAAVSWLNVPGDQHPQLCHGIHEQQHAELEACSDEVASFSYLTSAALFSGAASAAEDGAAEAAEGEESAGDLGAAFEEAIASIAPSCDAPAPTPLSEECLAVVSKCQELFPGAAEVTNELPRVEDTTEEGGESGEGEVSAEEGGEEAAAEEGGEEAAAEEGGEEAAAEEGGEA